MYCIEIRLKQEKNKKKIGFFVSFTCVRFNFLFIYPFVPLSGRKFFVSLFLLLFSGVRVFII